MYGNYKPTMCKRNLSINHHHLICQVGRGWEGEKSHVTNKQNSQGKTAKLRSHEAADFIYAIHITGQTISDRPIIPLLFTFKFLQLSAL